MYHDLPRTARFWSFLLAVDQDLAEEARKKACPCGGRLHSANYPRKPRGTPVQLPEHRMPQTELLLRSRRLQEESRHRRRCASSGRKVYLGAIVILISAMRQGPSPRRVRELSARFGADESTIARWQTSGANTSPKHPSGRSHAPVSSPLGEIVCLPYSLVDAFLRRHPPCEGWTLLLRFLSPITVPGGLQIKVSR